MLTLRERIHVRKLHKYPAALVHFIGVLEGSLPEETFPQ
jgi:hypothetical protein